MPHIHLSKKKKNIIIFVIGIMSALGPFTIDMYLPGFQNIADEFNVNTNKVGLSLTSYFIGISIGQLIYGPLLDRFGRKKPILFGFGLFIIASLLCFFSLSIEQLILARFIQALGGCVGMVAGRAIIKDGFKPEEMAKTFSMISLVMGIAPIIAPTLGGLIVSNFGWRPVFFILALMCSAVFLLVYLKLPETKGIDKTVSLKITDIFKRYVATFSIPNFILLSLASSFAWATMFAYISGSPFVFMKLKEFTESEYGIIFGTNALGIILGSQLNRFILKKITSKKLALISVSLISFLTTLLFVLNFVLVLPNIVIVIFLFLTMFNIGLANPNMTALTLNIVDQKSAGTASAVMGATQMFVGAIISVLVSALHNGTEFPMFGCMMLSSTIGLIFLLIAFKKK